MDMSLCGLLSFFPTIGLSLGTGQELSIKLRTLILNASSDFDRFWQKSSFEEADRNGKKVPTHAFRCRPIPAFQRPSYAPQQQTLG